MIKIIIKHCIAVKGLPRNIIEDVQADLTFDNPAYLSAKRKGCWIPQGVVPYIYLYQMTGDIIYFPKGYMNNLLHKIGKKEHTIIDHSISPELSTPITFTSTLRDYQEAATKDILPKRYGVLEAATGAGKCLGKGTPILMFNGSIKLVEDIIVGDILMGPDSLPRKVKTLARGTENLFKITPVKGDAYTVNESHILSLKMSGNKNTVVNIDIKSYLLKNNYFKHCAKGWRTGVQFQEKPINSIISPYILGVWLGDGTNKGPSISNPDIEIIKELQTYAKNIGIGLKSYYPEKRCPEHTFTDGQRGTPNIFLNELRRLYLIDNKHVPSMFKINSKRIRLEVLAGLIDTDGYGGINGYDFIFKDKQLAEDVLFLARSVGLAAYISESWKKCQGWIEKKLYYRVLISGNCAIIPCRVTRKRAAARKQKKDVLKTGITVTPLGIGEYFGFELEDSDGLFLLGDFTVTHNTAIGINIISVRNVRTLVLVHSKELLNQWQSALKKHTNIEKIGAIGDSKFDIQDVTIGIIQSVKNNIDKLQGQFGQVIADEVHRVFASSWVSVLNSLNTKYVLGLSATPYRREKFTTKGIYFLVGPKVHVVDKKHLTDTGAVLIPRVIRHPTGFRTDRDITTAGYSELISMISTDESRNRVIVNAIIKDITTYKEPVMIVSDRVAHCEALLDMLQQYRIVTPILLTGGKPAAYRKWAVEQLTKGESNALVSTTSLLGEGFDSPILNALFLCTPVKFEGRIVQVVGRILRPSACQELPRLIDFRDNNVEMLLRSGWARDSVYKRAGWNT